MMRTLLTALLCLWASVAVAATPSAQRGPTAGDIGGVGGDAALTEDDITGETGGWTCSGVEPISATQERRICTEVNGNAVTDGYVVLQCTAGTATCDFEYAVPLVDSMFSDSNVGDDVTTFHAEVVDIHQDLGRYLQTRTVIRWPGQSAGAFVDLSNPILITDNNVRWEGSVEFYIRDLVDVTAINNTTEGITANVVQNAANVDFQASGGGSVGAWSALTEFTVGDILCIGATEVANEYGCHAIEHIEDADTVRVAVPWTAASANDQAWSGHTGAALIVTGERFVVAGNIIFRNSTTEASLRWDGLPTGSGTRTYPANMIRILGGTSDLRGLAIDSAPTHPDDYVLMIGNKADMTSEGLWHILPKNTGEIGLSDSEKGLLANGNGAYLLIAGTNGVSLSGGQKFGSNSYRCMVISNAGYIAMDLGGAGCEDSAQLAWFPRGVNENGAIIKNPSSEQDVNVANASGAFIRIEQRYTDAGGAASTGNVPYAFYFYSNRVGLRWNGRRDFISSAQDDLQLHIEAYVRGADTLFDIPNDANVWLSGSVGCNNCTDTSIPANVVKQIMLNGEYYGDLADGDHGDFTYSSGTATLDAGVVGDAEMATTEKIVQAILLSATASDSVVLRTLPVATSVTRVECETFGAAGTETATIEICLGDDAGDDTCATSVNGGTIVCDADGQADTVIANPALTARQQISVVISAVSGTVDALEVYVEGTR